MNAATASLINAATLIVIGLYAYFTAEDPSLTALIPVVFGGLLLTMNGGVRRENKAIAHVAVILTLVILIALVMPLRGAIGRADTPAIIRVVIMMATTLMAMVFFVRSFIQARKNREQAAN